MCLSAAVKTIKEEKPSDSGTEMQVSRCREPEHFLLKVESFSELESKKYESDEFDAGGYKWRLILYPNGDKARNGYDHISLYLSICDAQNLPPGWQIEADFSLFVYNNLTEKYLTYKLASTTRFNWLKTETGFAQLMPLDEFKETSNGYLFGDSCVFGAEVYVTGFSVAKRQILSLIKKTDTDMNKNVFTWRVGNFSAITDDFIHSEKFMIKDVTWVLRLFPKGNKAGKDKSVSLYLRVADGEFVGNRKFDAAFQIRIRNQLNTDHVKKPVAHIFCKSEEDRGYNEFMALIDVKDKSKGYLINDSLVVEVEITKLEIIRT